VVVHASTAVSSYDVKSALCSYCSDVGFFQISAIPKNCIGAFSIYIIYTTMYTHARFTTVHALVLVVSRRHALVPEKVEEKIYLNISIRDVDHINQ
jgi:hypothetical protein